MQKNTKHIDVLFNEYVHSYWFFDIYYQRLRAIQSDRFEAQLASRYTTVCKPNLSEVSYVYNVLASIFAVNGR